ncbi:MAG: methionyl-tRNA formyltransferase [Bacteroides sp.]|nr:methionyl-tRNA formyltransferase [Bacteroides sp.]
MKQEDLRIVFLGTPEFAVESLDRLYKGGYNIVGVVTMPDKPAGRGHKMLHSPVKQYAEQHGLHLMQPVKLKDPEFIEELRSLNANLFIVIAFRMLPEIVWSMPELGTFNLHASLLPKYRGAAPINWAVINGETETGVTTFFLKHEIDTGDIIAKRAIEITPEDNVGTVHDRLMQIGAELTLNTVEDIINGTLHTIPQDDEINPAEELPQAPKIFKETCRIDWTQPAKKIHNLVRGLSPYPGAWTEINGLINDTPASVKIFETHVSDNKAAGEPGTISVNGEQMFVSTADNMLEILSLQIPGKRRMSAAEFIRGYHPQDNRLTIVV